MFQLKRKKNDEKHETVIWLDMDKYISEVWKVKSSILDCAYNSKERWDYISIGTNYFQKVNYTKNQQI